MSSCLFSLPMKVLFVDYGNEEHIPLEFVCILPPHLREKNKQVHVWLVLSTRMRSFFSRTFLTCTFIWLYFSYEFAQSQLSLKSICCVFYQAFECYLMGVKPLTSRTGQSRWTRQDTEQFKQMVMGKEMYLRVSHLPFLIVPEMP